MHQVTRASAPPAAVDPVAVTISNAVRLSGLSRSAVYRELAAGNLDAVKQGVRTLVLMSSLRAFIENLPRATFRAPRPISTEQLPA